MPENHSYLLGSAKTQRKMLVRAEIRAKINYKSSFANHFLWNWNPLVIVRDQSMHDIFCLSGVDRERHSLNRMLDK